MVLYVEVLAVGPFKRELVEHYEHPPERFAHTQDGMPLVTRLFGIEEGTGTGIAVANALGISNVWDVNRHKIDAAKIDFPALSSLLSGWDYYSKDVQSLRAFAAAGYDLYLLPNG